MAPETNLRISELTEALEMLDDGTSVKVDVGRTTLASNKVLCIIDTAMKLIYIWHGREAGVRKRFVGAQTASTLRAEQGGNYKVQAIDEGEEPATFLNSLN